MLIDVRLPITRASRWLPLPTAIVCAGIFALVTIVAMAARVSLDGGAPVNAAAAQTPVLLVCLVLLGVCAIGLSALLAILWPLRRDRRDEHGPQQPHLHWLWKVAFTLVWFAVGAAIVVAAEENKHRTLSYVINPGRLALGSGRAGHTIRTHAHQQTYVVAGWLPWTILALVLCAAIIAVAWLLSRRSAASGDELAPGSASGAAIDAALGALEPGTDPRTAVIAAYAAMERALAAHGVARSASEAPREYLRRVLAAASATENEATTLTSAFEEARFSSHPIGEQVRARALAALSSMRSRLGAARAG